jgi:hypothetical protein
VIGGSEGADTVDGGDSLAPSAALAIRPATSLRPDIVILLVGLSGLALLPVAYRAWRGRRTG